MDLSGKNQVLSVLILLVYKTIASYFVKQVEYQKKKKHKNCRVHTFFVFFPVPLPTTGVEDSFWPTFSFILRVVSRTVE